TLKSQCNGQVAQCCSCHRFSNLCRCRLGVSFCIGVSKQVKSRTTPVIDSTKALPPQATFRGPYVNTGSRDIGPDYGTKPKT
ncbi:hypothetical protein GIB67_005784, partial [Kingdonia uniflora]